MICPFPAPLSFSGSQLAQAEKIVRTLKRKRISLGDWLESDIALWHQVEVSSKVSNPTPRVQLAVWWLMEGAA